MAKQLTRHASVKPSEAQSGGTIGIPAGAVFEITEASWSTWEEAGEGALKGGREADDPALKIVADVEGADEPIVEFLGAGKASRFVPSSDGEYLDLAEGSTATAISDSCNANIFLKSVSDVKRHKKNAVDEDLLDDGITAFLVGLKGVAGREIVKRDFGDEGEGRKAPRPTLVVDEIIEGPSGQGKKGGKSSASPKAGGGSKRTQPPPDDEDEDEDEDDDKPVKKSASSKKSKGHQSDEDAASEQAERYVLEALALPKWKKGLPVKSAFTTVFNLVRGEEPEVREAVTEMIQDKAWVRGEERPWTVDEDDMIQSVE